MAEAPVDIRGFKGLNYREPPGMVQDDELVKCINLNVGRAGELTKRTGFSLLHNGSTLGSRDVKLLGTYQTADYSQLIAHTSNDKLWYSENGADWEPVATDVVEYAYNDLIAEFGFEDADVDIGGIEEITWGDGGLGCNDGGGVHTPALTDGYRILFENTATSTYYYYTGRLGSLPFRCDDPTWSNTDFTAEVGLQILIPIFLAAEFAVQYVNKLYIVSDVGIYEWNGSILSETSPSPEGSFCTVYKDRLFVLSSDATENSRLYFSAIAAFETWPSTNFFDVSPGDGDFIVACAVIHDLLIIFKTETTWALYVQGSPENWVLRNINPEIGCISKYTPREIEGFLFFVGVRGIYKTDGNIFENISESIEPLFDDRVVNLTTVNIDGASWWGGRYIVLLHPNPSTYRYLVYHLRTGGWTEWEIADDARPSFFIEVNSATPSKGLYAGNSTGSGKVYRHGDGAFTDAGVDYDCSFKTKDFDFDLPALMKRGKWMGIDVNAKGTVDISYEVEQESLENRIFSGTEKRRMHKVSGPGYFRVWSLEISNFSNADFIFYVATLWLHRKRSVIRENT